MKEVVSSVVLMVLQILSERDQSKAVLKKKEAADLNQSISSCQTKDMLFWGNGSTFVSTEKEKRFWTPSKII